MGVEEEQFACDRFPFLSLAQVIKVNETEGKFEVSLDVSQYRPDELKVAVARD